jgi:hypothetical protein
MLRVLPEATHHSTLLIPRSVKAQSISARHARVTSPRLCPASSSQQPISHTPEEASKRVNMTPPTSTPSSQIPYIRPLSEDERSA